MSPNQPSDAAVFPWIGAAVVIAIVLAVLLYLVYRRNRRRYLSDD